MPNPQIDLKPFQDLITAWLSDGLSPGWFLITRYYIDILLFTDPSWPAAAVTALAGVPYTRYGRGYSNFFIPQRPEVKILRIYKCSYC